MPRCDEAASSRRRINSDSSAHRIQRCYSCVLRDRTHPRRAQLASFPTVTGMDSANLGSHHSCGPSYSVLRLRSCQAATHHELASEVGEEAAAPLRRAELLTVEGVGNLGRRVAFIAQRRDPVHELVQVAELLVGPDGTDDLVPPGETLPANRDTRIFAVALDVHDDLIHQMPASSAGPLRGLPLKPGPQRCWRIRSWFARCAPR